MRRLLYSALLLSPLISWAHNLPPIARVNLGFDYRFTWVAAMPLATVNTAQPYKDTFAEVFKKFPRVKTAADDTYFLVSSDGMPDHPMMIGITNWQQQVPIPQAYTGANSWKIPLKPVVAKSPALIKGRFLRGAIAVAANGIPIFNPQNNRGEVSQDIGELDKWGGHCGRADDYHYHIIPLHLQATVGKGLPVAFALDGYPVYGASEPDGSSLRKLDECGGHEDNKFGYHYHGLSKSPYTFIGFHGQVTEAEGQVDPQPRANSFRPATSPLRGAAITDFAIEGEGKYKLTYTVNGDKRSISYVLTSTGAKFEFNNGKEGTTSETYDKRDGSGGGGSKNNDRPRKK